MRPFDKTLTLGFYPGAERHWVIVNFGVPYDGNLLRRGSLRRKGTASEKTEPLATQNPSPGEEKGDLWVGADLLQQLAMRRGPGREERHLCPGVIGQAEGEDGVAGQVRHRRPGFQQDGRGGGSVP